MSLRSLKWILQLPILTFTRSHFGAFCTKKAVTKKLVKFARKNCDNGILFLVELQTWICFLEKMGFHCSSFRVNFLQKFSEVLFFRTLVDDFFFYLSRISDFIISLDQQNTNTTLSSEREENHSGGAR